MEEDEGWRTFSAGVVDDSWSRRFNLHHTSQRPDTFGRWNFSNPSTHCRDRSWRRMEDGGRSPLGSWMIPGVRDDLALAPTNIPNIIELKLKKFEADICCYVHRHVETDSQPRMPASSSISVFLTDDPSNRRNFFVRPQIDFRNIGNER